MRNLNDILDIEENDKEIKQLDKEIKVATWISTIIGIAGIAAIVIVNFV